MSIREGISVLLAHGDPAARENLAQILAAAGDMRIVGMARDGTEAVTLAQSLIPDIVLVDLALPQSSGLATAETLLRLLPDTGVILLSREVSADELVRAMAAGVREYLEMPAAPGEVLEAIRRVYAFMGARRPSGGAHGSGASPRANQIVAVYSPKGGVGRTTLATNLAIAVRRLTGMQVAVVDASFPFGDVGVLLDLPATRSLVDLQAPLEDMTADFVELALLPHTRSGVQVLLAPPRPEMAEMVTEDLLRRTLQLLRETYNYVIVDTSPVLDERMLAVLDVADRILLTLVPTLSAAKSAKVFLELANLLRFPPDKLVPVVTQATTPVDIAVADLEAALGHPIGARIPTDYQGVAHAINTGEPLVLADSSSPIATAITDLARRLAAETDPQLRGASAAVPSSGARLRQFKLFRSG